jgi:AraC family transcriptional regulator
MAMQVEKLASGPGWSVSDIVCSSGPHDRPFEEQHAGVCIAAVMEGSFQYRTAQGAATMLPGAILLGNPHSCFECGHDHGVGDRCLSFMFDPGWFDSVLASVPGARSFSFRVPRLPPLASMTSIFAEMEFARSEQDPLRLEQVALQLAAKATSLITECTQPQPEPTRHDQRRIATAIRRIEIDRALPLSIHELARDAAMSPYHFLRTFRRVAGMTPHQFILRTRLQDAAVRLRQSSQTILDIALDAGFADLSTFNRRFRSIMGMTPRAYRQNDETTRASR